MPQLRSLSCCACLALATLFGACGGGSANTEDAGLSLCVRDVDCDDGLFCNGTEQCAPESTTADRTGCVNGVPACIGDSVCNEELDTCGPDCVDADGDGAMDISCGGTDCDDGDARRFPGAQEVCDPDGRDEDCDDSTFGFRDQDADGHADALCCNGDNCGTDCDDQSTLFSPLATELCDGEDNDCDGEADEDVVTFDWYDDCDGDLFGAAAATPVSGCLPPTTSPPSCGAEDLRARWAELTGDCDDTTLLFRPLARELCDGADNDCDGDVDEEVLAFDWYPDCDGDGFGRDVAAIIGCAPPSAAPSVCAGAPAARWAPENTDCDDSSAARRPGGLQVCDPNGDNSCGSSANPFDADSDGFDRGACGGDDCDDNNAATHPGVADECDGVDADCDGFSEDLDGDGFLPVGATCSGGVGDTKPRTDCDDANATVFPGAMEACDGADNDCNTMVDDTLAANAYCDDLDPVSSAICAGGLCVVRECPGFAADCDEEAANGCETSTLSDADHCGGCGRPCDFACGSSTCLTPRSISLGIGHGCLVLAPAGSGEGESGDVYCWGTNPIGELGIGVVGGFRARMTPNGQRAKAVSVGQDFSCAITIFDQVACWGSDVFQELGSASQGSSPTAVLVADQGGTGVLDHVTRLAASNLHTCVIRDGDTFDGEVWCWGFPIGGGLGTDENGSFPAPMLDSTDTPLSGFVDVATGLEFSCALARDGQVLCSGADDQGQMGRGLGDDSSSRARPVLDNAATNPLVGASAITAGYRHACALLGTDMWCWGDGRTGQLGLGSLVSQSAPVFVLDAVESMTAGAAHTCAIRTDGNVWCWGANDTGQLGRGMSPGDLTRPAPVASGFTESRAVYVTASNTGTCAVRADGATLCWGQNTTGELGDGTRINKDVPVSMARPL